MQRIIIIGCGGAGKSTFAVELGEVLNLPVVHLDRLHWIQNWQAVDKQQFVAAQKREIARPSWIIDGNYRGTLPMRIDAADTIIFLDFPTWLCVYGACRRWLLWHLFGRQNVGSVKGNAERADRKFLAWIWNYRRTFRPEVLVLLANVIHRKHVFALRSRADVRRFLRDVEKIDQKGVAALWLLSYKPKTD